MTGPQAARLPGSRLHLNHGPIDLVLRAWGSPAAVRAAEAAAIRRFETLLQELVDELPALRRPDPGPLQGPVARAMAAATLPHRPLFVTPMAAVAGAVADEISATMTAAAPLTRAYVNDGGDIALHLTPGASLTAALGLTDDRVTVRHADPVRGIATSGWRGRSHSLGIADAVTVLAASAAAADAAATLIANAVDLPGHPAIARTPARDLAPDSDLGDRPVTTAVGRLAPEDIARALAAGAARAEAMRACGLIAAALFLQGEARIVGPLPVAQDLTA